MGCDFKPGDEVECVDAKPVEPFTGTTLHEGRVYTIRDLGLLDWPASPAHGEPIVYLEETRASVVGGFLARRFRKVQRRKTDLSIESFLTIKPGFEEPRRPKAPAKKERVS